MPRLILLIGPIASGKSTIAEGLGVRLRASGHQVAVLDLDDAVENVGGFAGLTPELFELAVATYANDAATCLGRGLDVVAHGPLFEPGSLDSLLSAIPARTRVWHIRLHSTYVTALERVRDDPNHRLSKDPAFLKMAYQRDQPLLDSLPGADATFDTRARSPRQILDVVVELVE